MKLLFTLCILRHRTSHPHVQTKRLQIHSREFPSPGLAQCGVVTVPFPWMNRSLGRNWNPALRTHRVLHRPPCGQGNSHPLSHRMRAALRTAISGQDLAWRCSQALGRNQALPFFPSLCQGPGNLQLTGFVPLIVFTLPNCWKAASHQLKYT